MPYLSSLGACLFVATCQIAWAQADPSPADALTALVPDEGDPEPAGIRTPLILLHGLHGNAFGSVDDIANLNGNYFAALLEYFEEDPNVGQVYKIFRFHYVSDQFSFSEIGKALRNDLDVGIQQGSLPDVGLVLVAHSVGGLVARAYMEENHTVGQYAGQPGGERVSKLITLATPHHGTHAANDMPRLDVFEDPEFGDILPALDRFYWCGRATCPDEQFVDVTEPNRSDVRWDAYDGATAYDQCPAECNEWLQTLNGSAVYDAKIQAYYGFLNSDTTPVFRDLWDLAFMDIPFDGLPTGAAGLFRFLSLALLRGDEHELAVGGAVLLGKIYSSFSNDGIIPADSAAFAGHEVGQLVGCPGYDHLHMRDSHSELNCDNGLDLFANVKNDLLQVAIFPFSISDGGGRSILSRGVSPAGSVEIGYGRIVPEAGTPTPSGHAIFGFRNDGTLVSEAGVPASPRVTSGRIYLEVDGPVNTGLAIANPSDVAATINFYFTDLNGTDFGSGNFMLGAGKQIAKFLDQDPFNAGIPAQGSFTFLSSVPVSVIALRGLTNERSEFLMTTLPVAALAPVNDSAIHLPRFVDGLGWTTQVVLVNPVDEVITGSVQFLGTGSETSAGEPVTLTLTDGQMNSEFAYQIPARSARVLETSNPGVLSQGSVRILPDPGSSGPSGLVIFSGASAGITFTEAGVPASPAGTAFRMYGELQGVPGSIGSIRSGVAISNTSAMPTVATFELRSLDGSATGPSASSVLPGDGHIARFVDELFPEVTPPFQGVLRVTSSSAAVAVVGLRIRLNERGEFLITTTPPADEGGAPAMDELLFPHIVNGAGWTTQFIIFGSTPGQPTLGTLRFSSDQGMPLVLDLQ